MAVSVQFSAALLLISAVSLLISPAVLSQTCTSQTLPQNNFTFENCADLRTLGASLHWTYDAAATPMPTLSIAFTAAPASPSGWVAWALNPTAAGMAGAQALAAFREANGSIVVNTYNITSYAGIEESPISYGVLSKRAVHSGGVTTIFAVLALPEPEDAVNQVWQVGAEVRNGVPQRHAFAAANLGSANRLLLGSITGVPAPAPAPATAPSPATGGPSPPNNVGSPVRGRSWLYGGVLQFGVIGISLFIF